MGEITFLSQPDLFIETLYTATLALKRPKRFIAILILGIIVLTGMITSLALFTISLVKEIHTAYHTDQLSKNMSIVFMIQETIDRGLQDRGSSFIYGKSNSKYYYQAFSTVPLTFIEFVQTPPPHAPLKYKPLNMTGLKFNLISRSFGIILIWLSIQIPYNIRSRILVTLKGNPLLLRKGRQLLPLIITL